MKRLTALFFVLAFVFAVLLRIKIQGTTLFSPLVPSGKTSQQTPPQSRSARAAKKEWPQLMGLWPLEFDFLPASQPKQPPILKQVLKAVPKPAQQSKDMRRPNPYFIPKRLDIGHIEGSGVGYRHGFTDLSVVLAPEYKIGHFLPLAELRALVFDNGKWGANAGVMGLFFPEKYCEAFGFNVFYDFRQGSFKSFHQISFGVDILSKNWEVHANALVPIKNVLKQKCIFDDFIGPYFEVRRCQQFAYYFFDMSAGYYAINTNKVQLYTALEPYYLIGKSNNNAFGIKGIVRPQYNDWFSVEISASYDHIFGTVFQGKVVLTIPLYNFSSVLRKKTGPCGLTNRQIYQPVNRDIILHPKKCCTKFNW